MTATRPPGWHLTLGVCGTRAGDGLDRRTQGEPQAFSTERVFGPEVPTGPYKHPACLTELANGDLYLVYYGGQGEYARDTAVFGSRLAKGDDRLDAAAGHRARSLPLAGQRRRVAGARRRGVALLRRPLRRDVVHLAHPGEDLARQRRHLVRRLHAARGRGHDGAQPARSCCDDGDYLLPIYHEVGDDPETVGAGSTSLFLRYQRASGQWKQTGAIASPRGAIQPAVVEVAPGRLVAYSRRGGGYGPTTDGWLVRAESTDGGWTWTQGRDSAFPNPNAAVDFLKLKSGNLLLVYNDSMVGRTPLVAALSTDGDARYPHRRAIAEGQATSRTRSRCRPPTAASTSSTRPTADA